MNPNVEIENWKATSQQKKVQETSGGKDGEVKQVGNRTHRRAIYYERGSRSTSL